MKKETPEETKPPTGAIVTMEKPPNLPPKVKTEHNSVGRDEASRKLSGTSEKRTDALHPATAAPTTKHIESRPQTSPTVLMDRHEEMINTLKLMQENQKLMSAQLKIVHREVSSIRRDLDTLLPDRPHTVIDLDELADVKPATVFQQRTVKEFYQVVEPPPPKPLPPIFAAFTKPAIMNATAASKQNEKPIATLPERPWPITPRKRPPPETTSAKATSKKRAGAVARPLIPPGGNATAEVPMPSSITINFGNTQV